ncbi:integral membrane protein [Grosmannia clavigera kw1407]|uniref:Integral membrane protein n=1 Tax=Grosmannia clavigera (strain kw1407 / UAMH 11150) TaxID=655863 RepID=F0X8P5_GROCL|nr:uncharacterized protein CMQ_3808 [Grosmannia clavigera kw1407]EFX05739.1 integral membrane protein [Grosmannia clavigera kw1407]
MVTLWQLFYVLASPFIKISICANLIRIATQRRYVYPLYLASLLSTAMTVMAFIIVFIQCIPFTASWTGNGKCISIRIIIIPTYVFSAVNIFVDWVVAILPAFILWDLQLRRKLKLLCYSILAVGVLLICGNFSCIDKIGDVIVWTVVELSLGILAGSLPSLRKLFKSLSADHSTGDQSYGTDLPTLGRRKRNRATQNDTYDCELNITVRAERDGSSDGAPEKDDDSTRHIIHVTRDVTQVSIQEAP